ncbi:MAG: BTAD domain-containing putative transcriptional regulator [Anaerolineaceae bacterium]|nr:BTAD domain-containing putative transcriptional regulator [Anaerolineaceae bacterium]
MNTHHQIILSQLNPPAQRVNVLVRSRVNLLLSQTLDYPLSILTAGTGYGKTTSVLSYLETSKVSVIWYTLSRTDRDASLFLTKLFNAFNQRGRSLGQNALRSLESAGSSQSESLVALVNSLTLQLMEDTLLILDDFHAVSTSAEVLRLVDWLVEHLPPSLHLLILSRTQVALPSLEKWRATGNVLELDRAALTFTPAEIAELFENTYKVSLPQAALSEVSARTEGWAIALQMVWQSLRAGQKTDLHQLLMQGSASQDSLFAFLAREVLSQQEEKVQRFLVQTSLLSYLENEICDFLLDSNDSQEILESLHARSLFLEELHPHVYRYHPIFRSFLQSFLTEEEAVRATQLRIASYFCAHQLWEQALGHLLEAGDYKQVEKILERVGAQMVAQGRYETLQFWIQAIPTPIFDQSAYENYLIAEVQRYQERFEPSLESYRRAQRLYQKKANAWGTSMALRGQAQVYLDTIRPANATPLLNKAVELLDPGEAKAERSELLLQMAENQLNLGELEQATLNLQRSRQEGQAAQADVDFITARLYLRSGRLQEGIQLLQGMAEGEDGGKRPQRFHREASVMQALFYTFFGDGRKAAYYARQGLAVAEQLHASFVRNVGQMRLGHALQLLGRGQRESRKLEEIRQLYEGTIASLDIVRIHVEPMWGLARLYGYNGQLEKARQVARQAQEIAAAAGDGWIGMLVRLSLGASLALEGQYPEANRELTLAESRASQLGDSFSQTAAKLWLAYSTHQQAYASSSLLYMEDVLQMVQQHGYDFLLTQPSQLGANDPIIFVPLLLECIQQNLYPELAQTLLEKSLAGHGDALPSLESEKEKHAAKPAANLKTQALHGLNYHPGYRLHIKTLGAFEVFLGWKPLGEDTWKRGKAKTLLQILAASGDEGMSKERLGVLLWPDADQKTANNHFKVILNALNQALEPERPGSESAVFIQREGLNYRLCREHGIVIDHLQFSRLAKSRSLSEKRQAFELYQGRFLEGELAQEHFLIEEQHFHLLFLNCGQSLLDEDLSQKEYDQVIADSNRMIQLDPLYEPAYAAQMQAYAAMGKLSMACAVCKQAERSFTHLTGQQPERLNALLVALDQQYSAFHQNHFGLA